MRDINRARAEKSYKSIYVPKADDKKLIKAEIADIIVKALADEGIACLTGKDVKSSCSPFEMFFVLGGEQTKIHIGGNKNYYGHGCDFINNQEMQDLEDLQCEIDGTNKRRR